MGRGERSKLREEIASWRAQTWTRSVSSSWKSPRRGLQVIGLLRGRTGNEEAPKWYAVGVATSLDDVVAALKGTFTTKQLMEATGASRNTVSAALTKEMEAGRVKGVGPDPHDDSPGRSATLFRKKWGAVQGRTEQVKGSTVTVAVPRTALYLRTVVHVRDDVRSHSPAARPVTLGPGPLTLRPMNGVRFKAPAPAMTKPLFTAGFTTEPTGGLSTGGLSVSTGRGRPPGPAGLGVARRSARV